jgi:hypothetical protein
MMSLAGTQADGAVPRFCVTIPFQCLNDASDQLALASDDPKAPSDNK